MSNDKVQELIQEFRSVVIGESNLADTLIPTLVFLIVNGVLGFECSMWTSLVMGCLPPQHQKCSETYPRVPSQHHPVAT